MKSKEKAMANKNVKKTEDKSSSVKFTGRFWITPDGRKFNNRLKAEKYASEFVPEGVDSKS